MDWEKREFFVQISYLLSFCFVIEGVKSVNVYKIFSHTLGERRWKSEMEGFFNI